MSVDTSGTSAIADTPLEQRTFCVAISHLHDNLFVQSCGLFQLVPDPVDSEDFYAARMRVTKLFA